jgi:hypothetical protein
MIDIAHLREPALITEFDYPYPVKDVNAEWLRVCGFKSKDEVCGKKLDIIQGPLTDRKVVNQMMDTLKETGRSEARLTNYRRTDEGMFEPFECDISIQEYKENLDDSDDAESKCFMCIMSPRNASRGVSFGSFVEEHPKATKEERREAIRAAVDTSYHHRLAFDKTLSVPSRSQQISLGDEQTARSSSEPNWHESYSFGAFAAAEQLAQSSSKRKRCERVKLFADAVSQPAKHVDAASAAAPSLPPPPQQQQQQQQQQQALSAPPHTTSAQSYGSTVEAAAREGRSTSRAERREAMQRFLASTRGGTAAVGHSRL